MVPNAREVYALVVNHQLEDPESEGLDFKLLYRWGWWRPACQQGWWRPVCRQGWWWPVCEQGCETQLVVKL